MIMKDDQTEGGETQKLKVKDNDYGKRGYAAQTTDITGGSFKTLIDCENSLFLVVRGYKSEGRINGRKWLNKVSAMERRILPVTASAASLPAEAPGNSLFMNAIEQLVSNRMQIKGVAK